MDKLRGGLTQPSTRKGKDTAVESAIRHILCFVIILLTKTYDLICPALGACMPEPCHPSGHTVFGLFSSNFEGVSLQEGKDSGWASGETHAP
jgi:hypothetical protein